MLGLGTSREELFVEMLFGNSKLFVKWIKPPLNSLLSVFLEKTSLEVHCRVLVLLEIGLMLLGVIVLVRWLFIFVVLLLPHQSSFKITEHPEVELLSS